VGGLNNIETVV